MKRKQVNFAKKLMAVVLSVVMAIGAFSLCVSGAEGYATEGTLGENVTWKFTPEIGELRISGTGAIEDQEASLDYSLWLSIKEEVASVVIEDGITYIGRNVFYQLPNLTNVSIGNTVEEITGMAFYGCNSIESIDIPASVKIMYGNSFSRCSRIKNFTVDTDNEYYCAVSGVLFSKDMSTLVAYPRAKAGTSYVIPSGVITVGDYAFEYALITDVTIPYGVTTIGSSAFTHTLFTAVELPGTVKTIGSSAFENCKLIESVKIPDSIESIGTHAFAWCNNLADFTLPDEVISIGRSILKASAFSNIDENWINGGLYCGKHLLETSSNESDLFIVKAGTLDVAGCAFMSCGAKTVIIADSVSRVGSQLFWGNRLTEKVVFSGNIEKNR